jgi:excisionase family DNA binding protein
MGKGLPQPAVERLSYTIQEAAQALSVHVHTLQRAINHGLLRATQMGVRVHVPADEVRRLAADGLPKIPPGFGRKPAGGGRAVRKRSS